jgi:hypothetical protein
MRPLALTLILALALAPPAFAKGSKCRDAQGHYVKCPPAAAAPAGAAAPAAASAPATAKAPAKTSKAATPSSNAGYSSRKASSPGKAATTAAVAGAPAGATARCKDGSYSMSKGHSGACSHHGGVDSWLK